MLINLHAAACYPRKNLKHMFQLSDTSKDIAVPLLQRSFKENQSCSTQSAAYARELSHAFCMRGASVRYTWTIRPLRFKIGPERNISSHVRNASEGDAIPSQIHIQNCMMKHINWQENAHQRGAFWSKFTPASRCLTSGVSRLKCHIGRCRFTSRLQLTLPVWAELP